MRKDSKITDVADLKKKMIAFEEPFSSSGYLLPLLSLQQENLNLVEKRLANSPVRRNQVGFVFSNDDENTMVWVLRKKVAAGAMSEKAFLSEVKGSQDQLRIIHKTFFIPRQVVVVRKGIKMKVEKRLTDVLVKMDRSATGRTALKQFEKTKKFTHVPAVFKAKLTLVNEFLDEEFGLDPITKQTD